MPSIAAILLAAGGSACMGEPKQLLPYGGQPLVRRATESALAAGCEPVVVVAAHRAAEVCAAIAGLPVVTEVNRSWPAGIGSSIRRGAARLIELRQSFDAAILMLVDQPLLSAEILRALIQCFESTGKPVCVSAYADAIGPPVILRKELVSNLLTLPDASGAKSIWLSHPEMVAKYDWADGAMDVDTPADYSLLKLAEQG